MSPFGEQKTGPSMLTLGEMHTGKGQLTARRGTGQSYGERAGSRSAGAGQELNLT